jgi:hypothetical protein
MCIILVSDIWLQKWAFLTFKVAYIKNNDATIHKKICLKNFKETVSRYFYFKLFCWIPNAPDNHISVFSIYVEKDFSNGGHISFLQ